jgi:putative membrane-bound dehydrogenase-like protein
MHVRLRPTLLAAGLALATAASAGAVDDPQWQVPEGFTIELVAGPPLVNHPTMGGFDEKGRLYICDGPGENMPAKDLLAKLPNVIRRLEDTDGDGSFDKSTMFADKMTFPMGALWHQGYVYTASPPHIWRLRDTDDDGVADERKILVSEFGFTGNAADVHGCFLGPDGRIYWCDGRHGHNFTDENGNPISKGLAARLFSCKPDGSDVEAFAGGGMDNPVEVTFTDEGEPLGTVAIFDNKPDRVDAIIHWVHGGAYPYYPKVLDEFKKTGDLLPAVSRFGRVAPSGIERYRGTYFGPEYAGNLFHAQFNTHRIVRTKLEREGATFKSTDEDFVVSPHPDVHLTDVLEDADGSLLIVDTGGWFRIGCPTSQIAKPEILGGIYRLRRKDGSRIDDPRGLQLAWNDAKADVLIERLADPRPAVRDRAIAQLAELGAKDKATLEAIAKAAQFAKSVAARRNAVWVLTRIGTPDLAQGMLAYLVTNDPDASVRLAAARGLGNTSDQGTMVGYQALIKVLINEKDPAVLREAATGLGRFKKSEAVIMFRDAIKNAGGDRFLEHALTYAMIEINDGGINLAIMLDDDPNIKRAGLIALDQTAAPQLTRELTAALLEKAEDEKVLATLLGIIQKRPEWGDTIITWLKRELAERSPTPQKLDHIARSLLAHKAVPQIQALVAESLASADLAPPTRLLLLEAIERSELTGKQLPAAWAEQLARHLTHGDEATLRQAVQTAAVVGAEAFEGPLANLAGDTKRPEALRIAALKALGPRAPTPDAELFALLLSRLQKGAESLDRLGAADVLGVLPLSPPQRAALVEAVASAGPLELPALLTAFEKESLPAEGKQLIAALARSPGLENVTSAKLEKIVSAYPEDIRKDAEPLFRRINADIETQRARLAELAAHLGKGDKVRGKNIFTLKTTACIQCHKVADQGGQIGPDLTKVGQIRSQADLLESVIFPSASFVRGFESVTVTTSAGQEHTGILSRETPEAVYLKTAQKQEVRIARSDIDEIAPSKLSIMPQGMDKVMKPDELRDLIEYLQSLK